MSLANNKKSLIVATVAFCAAFCIIWYWASNSTPKTKEAENQTLEYVFTKTPIKKGDIIKEENLQMKKSVMEFEGAFKNISDVVGASANTNIEEDKIIIATFVNLPQDLKSAIPSVGFRAVALPIAKSGIPPYVIAGKKYDLYTGSNTMKIENVKVLNIIDQPENNSNKMIIFEIKNSDVPTFVDSINKKGGDSYMLIEKNEADYGVYKFTKKEEEPKKETKLPPLIKDGYIPPIENLDNFLAPNEKNIEPVSNDVPKKEVEVIVGSNKTKMEFSE